MVVVGLFLFGKYRPTCLNNIISNKKKNIEAYHFIDIIAYVQVDFWSPASAAGVKIGSKVDVRFSQ